MKIKKGYKLRELAGQGVVVATGEEARKFHGMIQLNETGSVIWRCLEKGMERDAIVESILNDYDVAREVARQDVDKVLRQLLCEGIVE